MSDPINNPTLTPQEADELLNEANQRSLRGGTGLSQTSVGIIKTTTLATRNTMLRAATGGLGGQLKARRITNLMIALDGSGSMLPMRYGVVQGLNDMIHDLADDKNPDRDSFELTIWIFRGSEAHLLEINDPANPGSKMSVANVPITSMPDLTIDDYMTSGQTPMYKTVLAALGAGSLRAERLRMGVKVGGNTTARKSSMNLLVVCSDGKDNVGSEVVGGNVINYNAADIQTLAKDLLSTEAWLLGVAYAGSDSDAAAEAAKIGFPMYRNVESDPASWRSFFGIVSKSAKAASQAATASQAGTGGNTFI